MTPPRRWDSGLKQEALLLPWLWRVPHGQGAMGKGFGVLRWFVVRHESVLIKKDARMWPWEPTIHACSPRAKVRWLLALCILEDQRRRILLQLSRSDCRCFALQIPRNLSSEQFMRHRPHKHDTRQCSNQYAFISIFWELRVQHILSSGMTYYHVEALALTWMQALEWLRSFLGILSLDVMWNYQLSASWTWTTWTCACGSLMIVQGPLRMIVQGPWG